MFCALQHDARHTNKLTRIMLACRAMSISSMRYAMCIFSARAVFDYMFAIQQKDKKIQLKII